MTISRDLTAPMTFGQLSVLRSMQYNSSRGESMAWAEGNSPDVWDLPDDCDIPGVQSAWRRLRLANQGLRTVYEWRAGAPTQTVQPFRSSTVDTVEIDRDSRVRAEEIAAELSRPLISIDVEHPWRCVIATYQGKPRFLCLTWHHIAVDDLAVASLREQFDHLLAGRSLPKIIQPAELARDERFPADRTARTIEYWARSWTEFAEQDRAGEDDTERVQAGIYSTVAIPAIHAISDRLAVSPQTVTLGATYVVLSRLLGRSRITLGLQSSNRFDKAREPIVASMTQLAPLTTVAAGDVHPDAFLLDLNTRCAEAYLHGSYHVDLLRERLVADGVANPEPMEFDCYFNFVDPPEFAPAPDSPMATSVEWLQANRQTGPRFRLLLATGDGLLAVLRSSHTYLDRAGIAGFLTGLEAALVDLADRRTDTVDQIRFEPIRPTPLT